MSEEELELNNSSEKAVPSETVEPSPKKKTTRKRVSKKVSEVSEEADSGAIVLNGRMEFSPDEDTNTDTVTSIAKDASDSESSSDADADAEASDKSDEKGQNRSRANNSKSNRNRGKETKNNRFKQRNNNNNNKRNAKKGGARWQNRKQRSSDESDLIEFEELLRHEPLEKVASIQTLLDSLEISTKEFDLDALYAKDLNDLREDLSESGIELSGHMSRYSIIQAFVDRAFAAKEMILTTGVLDLLEEGQGGFIVYESDSYRIKRLSPYVPQALIDHYGLQKGHIIQVQLHAKA